ncbi:hypothetical protein HNQ94_003921 [Salirhabdus euzebyi]|uniref:FbpB family small basic protein n=1 Tax=Salirhabdus euzebyi TaxID=394506 RepID=A0A841QA75_9BACI|nr:FbpB family small basic protein [Salirhabdus euzebyi]MBB6455421.1 hypothetical protein [Salirhabdus euzebyi]
MTMKRKKVRISDLMKRNREEILNCKVKMDIIERRVDEKYVKEKEKSNE